MLIFNVATLLLSGGALISPSIGQLVDQSTVVVQNQVPDSMRPSLRLSPRPTYSLTPADGVPMHTMNFLADAVLAASGHLVVSVEQGSQVRIFAPGGRHVRTIEGSRLEVGKFLSAIHVYSLPGDTIVLATLEREMHAFTLDGRPLGSRSGIYIPRCCFADGSYLTREEREVDSSLPPDIWPGSLSAMNYAWLRNSSVLTGLQSHVVVQLLGGAPGVWPAGSQPRLQPSAKVPFAPEAFVGVSDSSIVYARSSDHAFYVYAPDGALKRIVKTASERRAVGVDDSTRVMEIVSAQERTRRSALTTVVASGNLPDSVPAFGKLEVEEDGTVWMRNYWLPWQTQETAREWWARYDKEGRLTGVIRIPPGYELLRFTRGHAIITQQVASGLRSLWVHRVEASPGR